MGDNLLALARQLDVADVAERLQIERYPKERAKRRCPACGTGGLHIYKEGPAYCFGCSTPYNALDLAMAAQRMDVREAAELLASLYGLTPDAPAAYVPPRPHVSPEQRARVSVPVPPQEGREGRERDQWGDEAAAVDALAARRIPAVITRAAGITCITREDWTQRLASMSAARAQAAGYLRHDPERDRMAQLLYAFPALRLPYRGWAPGDPEAERFALIGAARERDPRKYISPYALPPQTPFGAELVRDLPPDASLYLCEGEVNALSLRAIGLHAISCSGSGTWREEWAARLARVAQLVLVLDGDAAGDGTWARQIVESLDLIWGASRTAARVSAITCPAGKDANDLLRAGVLRRYLDTGTWRACQAAHVAVRVTASLFPLLAHLRPGEQDEEELIARVRASLAWWEPAAVTSLIREGGHIAAWQAIHEEGHGQPVGACAYGRLQWYVDSALGVCNS